MKDKNTNKIFKSGIIIIFILMMSTFILPTVTSTSSLGDLRGGNTSTSGQLQTIFSSPLGYINVLEDNIKEVITEDNKYLGKVLIIASGSAYRTLNLPNEDKLIGHGIHFCVACDGAFYKGKDVAIIGGGNSAVINAYSMSKIAKKVYILQKMDRLTCEKDLINKIESTDNVEIMYNVDVLEYLGEDELTGLSIKVDGKKKKLNVDGVFLNIGLIPQNKFANDVIDLDERDYVISTNTETKVPGLYVIGDSRTKKYSQVTIATADGTIAALNAIDYLNG